VTVTKTWVVTSSNPRPSHDAIDGETVGMDEVFGNGLAYPGDQSTGDPGETANCSCVMAIDGEVTPPAPDFATVQDAVDHMTETLRSVGNNSPYPVHMDWETAAGTTKTVSVEMANSVAGAVDDLTAKIPDVMGKISGISVNIDAAPNYAWVTSRYPGSINLNAKWFGGDLAKLEKSLARDAANGFAATGDIEGVIAHESAHVLFGTIGSVKKASALLEKAGFTQQTLDDAAKLVSKYAGTDPAEFVGELFAAAVRGGGKYADSEFVRAFRKVLIDEGVLKP
jgi:hypothetical protein